MSIIRGSAMEFIRNFDYMSREEKTCMYLINMRPVLNSRGLFHDCTEEYRNPSEPDKNTDVFIKFRTVKNNADKVGIVTDGVYTPMKRPLMILDLIIIQQQSMWERHSSDIILKL